MPNYSKGKVYRLVCNTTNQQYVGSTTAERLSQRLAEHKSGFKRDKQQSSSIIIAGGNCSIILIEDYPCQNKDQLRQRERYWQEQIPCVNKQKAISSLEEKAEYNRAYANSHREKYKELNKKLKRCECGADVPVGHFARHKQSKKHLNLVSK